MRKASCFVIALVVAALSAGGAWGYAQVDQLLGRITDGAGKPLPGVQVTLKTGDGKSYVAGTDEQGIYRFESLSAGRYQLHAELFGFQPYDKGDIEVGAQEQAPLQLDFSLPLNRREPRTPTTITPAATPQGGTSARVPAAPAKTTTAGAPPKAAETRPPAPTAGSSNRPRGPAANRSGAGLQRGEQQPFQNVTLQNTPEAGDASALPMNAANPSEPMGAPDNPASNIPSEAFLINGSINFGVQGAPQGPGGDFMNDPRFQMIRERLGIAEPGQPGEGFFQGGMQGGMTQMGGPGGGRGAGGAGPGGGPGGRAGSGHPSDRFLP